MRKIFPRQRGSNIFLIRVRAISTWPSVLSVRCVNPTLHAPYFYLFTYLTFKKKLTENRTQNFHVVGHCFFKMDMAYVPVGSFDAEERVFVLLAGISRRSALQSSIDLPRVKWVCTNHDELLLQGWDKTKTDIEITARSTVWFSNSRMTLPLGTIKSNHIFICDEKWWSWVLRPVKIIKKGTRV